MFTRASMLCVEVLVMGPREFSDVSRLKVFSATKARDRQVLGEKVTAWLAEHNRVGVAVQVHQSSDNEFHCLSVIVQWGPK